MLTVIKSNYSLKDNEFYETEPWAIQNILNVLPISTKQNVVWEPAAGNHKIANVLKENGFSVYTSDIKNYNYNHDGIYDFFKLDKCPFPNVNTIITNPPYGKGNRMAVEFCRKALQFENINTIAMLLTSKFDFGKTRVDLFRDCPYFYGEIKLLDRISWAGNGKTGTEDHGWFLWNKKTFNNFPKIFYVQKQV